MKSSFFQQFNQGFSYTLTGLRLITRPGLRRFVVVPILVNLLIFLLLFVSGLHYFQQFMDWVLPTGNSRWLVWLRDLLWVLFALMGMFLIFFSFSTLANLLGSPFNGLLAEAVERNHTGQSMDSWNWRQFALSVVPMVINELRKLRYFALISLPVLLLFFVPGVNLLAPLLWAVAGVWIMALEYLDYPMANHRHNFRQVRSWFGQHRPLGLGFGTGMLLGIAIPGLNLIMMPVGVAAATLLWLDTELLASRDSQAAGESLIRSGAIHSAKRR